MSSYATKSDVNTARTLGVTGLIAGVLALVAGGIAVGAAAEPRYRNAGSPLLTSTSALCRSPTWS
jgi:hypothetical protein